MRLLLARGLPLLALGVACSSRAPGPDESDEILARASSAVINGSLDTAHPAVVALILQKGSEGGIGSGTIET